MSSKYESLRAHLAQTDAHELTIPLAEIESLVGGLPRSAWQPQFWENLKSNQSHVQQRSWQSAGFDAFFLPRQKAVHFVRKAAHAGVAPGYWVLVCNPKKWAIDRFLATGKTNDTWGVRKSDQAKFARGQLALVRVGVDRRTRAQLRGNPRLVPGIYAICQIDSTAFPARGASTQFWADGSTREAGWPTVKIRYLHTLPHHPLTIDRIRTEQPNISRFLLDGLEASSFGISQEDFEAVVGMVGLDLAEIGDLRPADGEDMLDPAELWSRFNGAAPSVKEKISRMIERGQIGAKVKMANGHRCQICKAFGQSPLGFVKRDGTPYIEAHHVVSVSSLSAGVLSAANVITVCANHHRELHFGRVEVEDRQGCFAFTINGKLVEVPKFNS